MAGEGLLLESKHADIALEAPSDVGWSLWFFDQPQEGQCLSVEYVPDNYPGARIAITTTVRAGAMIREAKESGWYERVDRW